MPFYSPFCKSLSCSIAIALAGRRENDDCRLDRKSTRLNSSHQIISYAVFCLKKKKKNKDEIRRKTPSTLIINDATSKDVYEKAPNSVGARIYYDRPARDSKTHNLTRDTAIP